MLVAACAKRIACELKLGANPGDSVTVLETAIKSNAAFIVEAMPEGT